MSPFERCPSGWVALCIVAGVTRFVTWAVKPFSMALLGWTFVRRVFAPWLPADQLDGHVAGLILLAAAPAPVHSRSDGCERPAKSPCRAGRPP
jgi:ACR3 family arsenite efflux pump ArsB